MFFKVISFMKKKNKKQENSASPSSDVLRGRAKRQKEAVERAKKISEKKRNELFRKRVRSATEQKAPETVRTKAYYRFSKDYPSVVDHEGFRENLQGKEKLSVRGKIILSLCFVAVFLLTLFVTELLIVFSEREIVPAVTPPEEESVLFTDGQRLSPEVFIESTAEEISGSLTGNTILLDVKNEEGYIHISDNIYKSKKLMTAEENLKEKLTALKNEHNIDSIAYISCFTDSTKPYEYTGMELMTSLGEFFRDDDRNLWLNPLSENSQEYVLSVIKAAADCGFTYILLDNVCFPTAFSLTAPYYGENVKTEDRASALISFINKAVDIAGAERIILNCDITAFVNISELPNEKYGGELLSSDCLSYCIDFRASKQYTEQLKNSEIIQFIEEMPLAFIIDAGSLAKKSISSAKEAYSVLALFDSPDDKTKDYISRSGIDNKILFSY
ncbi:MAG: hypothetical protein E7535_03765 [Ruminococcaceae bacterium]|nr:hypothetical protein [Oscillospiraceae bacterium]